jgi:hypothetical protein
VKGAENVSNIGVAPEDFGRDVADVYLHALNRCIELAAASAAARSARWADRGTPHLHVMVDRARATRCRIIRRPADVTDTDEPESPRRA